MCLKAARGKRECAREEPGASVGAGGDSARWEGAPCVDAGADWWVVARRESGARLSSFGTKREAIVCRGYPGAGNNFVLRIGAKIARV